MPFGSRADWDLTLPTATEGPVQAHQVHLQSAVALGQLVLRLVQGPLGRQGGKLAGQPARVDLSGTRVKQREMGDSSGALELPGLAPTASPPSI
jgi:hypothetical protein